MLAVLKNATGLDEHGEPHPIVALWKPLLALVLLFALFFEARALIRVTTEAATPAAVLGMAQAGQIADARVVRSVLVVHPKPKAPSFGASVREGLGLPPAGRVLKVRATEVELSMLASQLRTLGVDVAHAGPSR